MTLQEIAGIARDFHKHAISLKDIEALLDKEQLMTIKVYGKKVQGAMPHSHNWTEKMEELGKRLKVLDEMRRRLVGGTQTSLL